MSKYLLSLDQGTTTSRTVLFNLDGSIAAIAKVPFKQYYPQPGWVEHDAEEIYHTILQSMRLAMDKVGAQARDIAAIGITNQRETVLIWDKETGKPIHPAIVWQCRRTADMCHRLVKEEKEELIHEKTGLILDAYFSATKLRWILDHVPGSRARAERGELLAGTIDTWLLWKLTEGATHATDVSNASRTLLYNIHTLSWDEELLQLFQVPRALLPEVCPSSHLYGYVREEELGDTDWQQVPIAGIAGDQQAALFGQACFDVGMIKSTYGTGGFILAQTGETPVTSRHRLLTTIAWDLGDGSGVRYALEGSVFHAGSTLQWLKDDLGLIQSMDEIEPLAKAAGESEELFLVPAFTGLGAPYWNMEARGVFVGLTRAVNRAAFVRTALESIAYQVSDVFDCIAEDCREAGIWKQGQEPTMRVDGGVAVSETMLRMQADLIQGTVERPMVVETTALGAAMLAGLRVGIWKDKEELRKVWKPDCCFHAKWTPEKRQIKRRAWHHAVQTALFATGDSVVEK